jgi:hypothetical protein
VGHAAFEPQEEKKFSAYLQRLQAWSQSHPSHRVVTVQIDAKDLSTEPFFVTNPQAYEFFIQNLPQKLDDYIETHFDTSLLYKPADLLGGLPDLVTAARTKGWPTLGELNGKFIFVFSKSYDDSRLYSDYLPSERLCFAMARMSDEDSFSAGHRVFFQWGIRTNETVNGIPWEERARRELREERSYFILRGQNICQDADEDGDPDCQLHPRDIVEGEYADGLELWAMATAAGINMISADLLDEQSWAMVGTVPLWPIAARHWGFEGSSVTDVNGATSTDGPAAAAFGGELRVACEREGSLEIFMGDGITWSPAVAVGQEANGRPALAVYDNRLWAASRSQSGDRLVISSSDGSTWSSPLDIAAVSENCGMAAYNDELYVVYPDAQSQISYRRWNGTEWSAAAVALGKTASAPAVCVFQGKLCVIYRGLDASIARTDWNGTGWSTPYVYGSLNGARSSSSPAVMVIGEEMDVIFRGAEDDRIYAFTHRADGHVSGQTIVLNAETSTCVGVAAFGAAAVLVHKDSEDGSLWARTMTMGP